MQRSFRFLVKQGEEEGREEGAKDPFPDHFRSTLPPSCRASWLA
jgi:hypothetical protein